MKFAIVTGVSRGLGESIARFLLETGIHVYGISRSVNERLTRVATENNVAYNHYVCDLANMDATTKVIETIKNDLEDQNISELYVVNNAAMINPIDQASKTKGEGLSEHFQVNVIAPMMITNAFLSMCIENKHNRSLIVANITSGAAERPIYGWSAYCSSKASLNMYTKTVALEQEQLQTDNKVFAFSPGLMDTNMQAEIRSNDAEQFADVDTFKNYKKQNLLSDTDAIAGVLVDILTDEVNIENGKIYNVRDYF